MAETQNSTESGVETGEIRGQLVKRLAVAGALVAILLGVLVLFDRLSSNNEELETPAFTKPVPVQAKRPVTQAVTPAPLPEPTVVEPPPAPKIEDPSPPKPDAVPVVEAASPKQPNAAPVAKAPIAVSAKPAAKGASVPPSGVPESTAPPVISSEQALDEATASARVIERNNSPARRLFSGFLVQAGVFTSAQRAEELQAQLNLNGVPATLEARVQVGPFKTRQEAEAAQEKLRQMGVESLLVPPKGAKR
jgi:DedD protein